MLTIRREQMEVFREWATAEFAERLSACLERRYPAWDSETRILRVRRWMAEAESYDIRRECDVARYVELAAAHWLDAAAPKGALRILSARQVNAAERLERAAEWLVEEFR